MIFNGETFRNYFLFLPAHSLITGCPVDWYPLSISIPDFPDGPMKKN